MGFCLKSSPCRSANNTATAIFHVGELVRKSLSCRVIAPDVDFMQPEEQWKTVNYFDGRYEVSNLGKVRISKTTSYSRHPKGYLVTPFILDGYKCVVLFGNKTKKLKSIHRLILETFVSPCPVGMLTRHRDGNRLNNNLSNLLWGTPRANRLDMVEHGTLPVGSRHGRAKLTESDVQKIKRFISVGTKQKVISKMFSVCKGTISHINTRRIWKHV